MKKINYSISNILVIVAVIVFILAIILSLINENGSWYILGIGAIVAFIIAYVLRNLKNLGKEISIKKFTRKYKNKKGEKRRRMNKIFFYISIFGISFCSISAIMKWLPFEICIAIGVAVFTASFIGFLILSSNIFHRHINSHSNG